MPEQSLLLQCGRVPLQGAAAHIGAEALEGPDIQARGLQQVLDHDPVPRIEPMSLDQHIGTNGHSTARLDLGQLGSRPPTKNSSQPVKSISGERTL